jgi:hypothetical protein
MVTEDDHDSPDRMAATQTAYMGSLVIGPETGVRAPHVRMSKPIHTTN